LPGPQPRRWSGLPWRCWRSGRSSRGRRQPVSWLGGCWIGPVLGRRWQVVALLSGRAWRWPGGGGG